MAKTRLQIERALAQQRKLENLPKSFIASLGDRNGTVSAGGNNVYVRDIISGFTFVAKNVSVPNVPGRLVNVEQRGRELYVIGFWNIYGAGETSESYVGPHDHGYGGENPIFITKEQIKPFSVLPYSGFTVQVFGGVFITSAGEFGVLQNQQVDLSGYQPASGAVYALLEYDDTGTLSVTVGTSAYSKDALALSDISAVTDHPLCAIRLYASQTQINRDPNGLYDFVDPRFQLYDPNPPHNNMSEIDGGGDYLGVVEAYHLTVAQWEGLVKGLPADDFHFHNASNIVVDPYGCIESTDLQSALEELETKIDALPEGGGGSWDGDITDIDETSSSDIGEAIADGDQGIIYNTSASAWVRFAWSRIATYIGTKIAGYISGGSSAPSLASGDNIPFEQSGLLRYIDWVNLLAQITALFLPADADYDDISGNDGDTDVTGAELEELTDGSETTLHSHSRISTVIEGLGLQWDSASSITVLTGRCYAENGDEIDVTSSITKSGLSSLDSDTWYHVYAYLDTGTPAAEVVTTAPTAWKGTAKSQTGDTSKRYLFSVLTDSSGDIIEVTHLPQAGYVTYKNFALASSPFRVLNGGTATAGAAVDLTGAIPETATIADIKTQNTSDVAIRVSEDSNVGSGGQATIALPDGSTVNTLAFANISMDGSQQIWYLVLAGRTTGALYIDVKGYFFER
jgi:hypothetical protein